MLNQHKCQPSLGGYTRKELLKNFQAPSRCPDCDKRAERSSFGALRRRIRGRAFFSPPFSLKFSLRALHLLATAASRSIPHASNSCNSFIGLGVAAEMAEREGFEPSVDFTYARFPGVCLKP